MEPSDQLKVSSSRMTPAFPLRFLFLTFCFLASTSNFANAQIDLELELDKKSLVNAIKAENWQDVLALTATLRLKGVDLGNEILFFEGRANKELGNIEDAETKLIEYVNQTNGNGANYGAALDYLAAFRDSKAQREIAKREQAAKEAAEIAADNGNIPEMIPIRKVQPMYPIRAIKGNIEGWCMARFTVTEDGSVVDARVIDAEPKKIFDSSCLKAVSQFKYKPRIENGKAVKVFAVQNLVTYALSNE